MEEGQHTLGVGMEIDAGRSFETLAQLQRAMGSTEARVVAEAAKIERATAGMINIGGGIAQLNTFGNAATREALNLNREKLQLSRTGEALIRQLVREAAAIGKTKDEIRDAKVEAAALAAVQLNNAGLADRLLVAARQRQFAVANAAEERAMAETRAAEAAGRVDIALRAQASAAAAAARDHGLLAAQVRGSAAAQEADAAAAERLRMATDPLYAATSRLNGEIAESTRLYQSGFTAPAEYARQQEVLTERLRGVTSEMDRFGAGGRSIGGTAQLAGHHMQNLAFQFQDLGVQMFAAAGSADPLKMAFMALLQQGAQIQGIMSQAGIGVRGVGAAFATMSKTILIATVTNPYLMAFAAAATAAAVAIKMVQNAANDSVDMKAYAASLGLTTKEIRQLDNVTVTFGDTAKAVFQVAGRAIWDGIGPSIMGVWNTMKEWTDWIAPAVKGGINFMIGGFVGAYNAITKTWQMFPAAMGDAFYSAVNASIGAINVLVQKSIDGLNLMIGAANTVLGKVGLDLPKVTAPQIAAVQHQFSGVGLKAGKAFSDEVRKAMGVDYVGAVEGEVARQSVANSRNRLRGQAEEKGYLDPEKSREHAKKISDKQKAYEAALKAASDYISAVEKETARIGKSAKEIRLLEDAIQRAAAPTVELKRKIAEVAAAREAAYGRKSAEDFQANVMQPLRDELALYGLLGPARAQAALELEKQAFIAKNMDDGITVATQRWREYYAVKSQLIAKDSAAEAEAARIKQMADDMNELVRTAQLAGDGMASAFGRVGGAIGDALVILAQYREEQAAIEAARIEATGNQQVLDRLDRQSASAKIGLYGDMTSAAKGFFKEGSSGYKALATAEKVFRIAQLAMSLQAMVQSALETTTVVAGAAARATAEGTAGIAAQSKLPFPFNIVAMAATGAALVAAGISIFAGGGGGGSNRPSTNTGTGTVFGDSAAKSESIKRAIDALKEVDTLMLSYSRDMAASLRSIDSQIGSVASLVVRAGNVDASAGVETGFKANAIGSVLGNIPVIGGLLKGLFGSSTKVIGSGLFGGPQSLGSILGDGFDASYYSDVQKKKKFFGLTTSTKYRTEFTGADPALENQFTLILRSFSDAIAASAGPLGLATSDVQARLNSFVVSIGKLDLKGLSGEEIEEKLSAVFGAAADQMANAAIPGLDRFQKVGEGAFETLVRVASTVEAVTSSLTMLGGSAQALGIDVKMALADQFDSASDFTSAASAYFERYYSQQEQTAARTAQFATVFTSLGLAMPSTLAGFRQLVEAQNLTTAAGQSTYATLLQLAPAFADLQQSMQGARSAADILSERTDLERRLLELQGDTAAIRALDLAKLDASNRAIQLQIWAVQDAQEAARAADDLRKAWSDVGTSIMDEVKRIRGITDGAGGGGFASLMGQFNATTGAARGGDLDSAKLLPGLSQAVLKAASDAARSRQELDRVQAQVAASLEATFAAINSASGSSSAAGSADALLAAMSASPSATAPAASANDTMAAELAALRAEVAAMRSENNAGHAATAGNAGKIAKVLDNLTAPSGGDAINVGIAA